MEVIHLSKEEALALVDEGVKRLNPNRPVTAQIQRPTPTPLWKLIREIEQKFHGVWRDDLKRFSWPC